MTAYELKAGKVVGNDKNTFDLKKIKRDFSHEFTGPLKMKKLTKWGIIYSDRMEREYSQFVKDLQFTC